MRAIRLLAALGLILASFALATPVAAGDPCYHDFAPPARDEGDEPQIKMMPCAFAPTVVRIAPGTIVEWFNDVETHLLTGANQEWGFRDAQIGPAEEVAFRFDRPGTYPYACALHRGMVGTIVVGDGINTEPEAGSSPAVVTVKAPSAARASPSPSSPSTAAAAVPPPGAALATPAAAAPVDPASAANASTERAGLVPVAALAVVALIIVAIAVVRLAAGRRTIRRAGGGATLEG